MRTRRINDTGDVTVLQTKLVTELGRPIPICKTARFSEAIAELFPDHETRRPPDRHVEKVRVVAGCELNCSLANSKFNSRWQHIRMAASRLKARMNTKMTKDGICHVAVEVAGYRLTVRTGSFKQDRVSAQRIGYDMFVAQSPVAA